MSYGCSVSDTVKIEIDELRFLTGCDDANKAVEIFGKRYPNVSLLTVTAGRNGSRAYYKDAYAEAPTFLNVKTIDTTGAGDTFVGSFLYAKPQGWDTLASARFACAAGSVAVEHVGANTAIRSKDQVLARMNGQ